MALCGSARAESPRFESMVTDGIHDLQTTITFLKADAEELRRIQKDFGFMSRLRELEFSFKDPDKFRMQGKIGYMIVNGTTQYIRLPQLGIKKRDEIGAASAKRHSLLDIGIFSRSALAAASGKFVREEPVDGAPAFVFEVTYSGDPSTRNLVWLRSDNHAVVKREWYDATGKLKATFLYLELKEIKPGIWLPSRVEIHNGEGTLAGILASSDFKLNLGLRDSLFDTAD
jgi:hypothetical protein